jgi:hypothetical protein
VRSLLLTVPIPDLALKLPQTVKDYDDFNAEQAKAMAEWAQSDSRVVGIVVWPWVDFLPMPAAAGMNIGLKSLSNASATWNIIGKEILASPPVAPAACGLRPPLSPPLSPPVVPRPVVGPGLRIMTSWDANDTAQAGWTSFIFGRGEYEAGNPCADVDFREIHGTRCHLDTLRSMAVRKEQTGMSSFWGPVCGSPSCGGAVKVNLTNFGTHLPTSGVLSADGASYIDDTLLSLKPFIENGTIDGIFLEDEMTCDLGYPLNGWAFEICESLLHSKLVEARPGPLVLYRHRC